MSQDNFDSITISLGGTSQESDTIDLSPFNFSDVSINSDLYPNVGIFSGPTWTTTTTGTSGSWSINDLELTSPESSGKLKLQGEDADIEINGRSLMTILDSIEQRLGLLKCREDLEQDWLDLKQLGDQYREKVKFIEEKVKVWDALKQMPPPEIK